ncbi:hypothetical protein SAMN05192533_11180 [Mesobacillus persicus]|uniref:Uncharacterized protein n=1 Tax=Mesobacillus persicus TaxID=930146 RepID=A0A1H8FJ93_9BACI|nr:hypothetical protein [Mesobacillus persicus]SEN31706.1 hypothetical protein SAMN05192533_11180 [Mesobacillus persicus]
MRIYSVILLQWIIWSAYTFTEWLSKHDHPTYNVIMFLIFLYIGFNTGNIIIKSKKKTLLATLVSLSLYLSFHVTLSVF